MGYSVAEIIPLYIMAIKKKNTGKLRHIASSIIKGAELPDESTTPMVLFSMSRGKEDSSEVVLPTTREAFARIKYGAGATHKALRHGLLGKARFRFIVMIDHIDNKSVKGAGKEPTVVGIHCCPNDNYLDANFEDELHRSLPEDAAVVCIHPETGELDVTAFPPSFKRYLDKFIGELEKLESIDTYTKVSTGNVNFTVSSISDNEVTFSCRKANPMQ